MTAWLIHYMAPIMFGSLVVFLLLGYPVAFALAANGLLFGLIGIELGLFQPDFLQALPQRVYGVMSNDTLLAIPFFTFMGLILERSGMAEDLLDTIGQLFGTVRGGLAYAVIFVGALLAATTGVIAASVIAMACYMAFSAGASLSSRSATTASASEARARASLRSSEPGAKRRERRCGS